MSDKPMFIFAGVYDSLQDAEDDFAAVKALHSGGMIGSYDSVILSKSEDGKVKVTKTEKPTQHGAWIGLAAGAAVAIAAPVTMPVLVAGGGAGLGAWIGHLARGFSRADAREIGEQLEAGTAALIVVGVDKDAERVEKVAEKAAKYLTKQIDADHEVAEKDVEEALAQDS